jgi:hypothetical protein
MGSIEYIKSSANKAKKNNREYYLFNDIPVMIKDFISNDEINLSNVLKRIEQNIPKNLFSNLDAVYVGEFPELDAKNVESVYMDGAIYLSNKQIDEENLYKSIIHELAHNLEEYFQEDIYGDEKIISEFISKRKSLRSILESNKLFCNHVLYLKLEFDEEFDNFLYKTVGYDKLALLTTNIFLSPYAATSLREYFSNGFEHYFSDIRPEYFNKLCPKLYFKISSLTKQ